MTTWEERKRVELAAKVAGLGQEFAEWRELSEPGGRLEKHCTQVRRVTDELTALLPQLTARVDGGGSLLATWAATERMVLELHRIWEFFRLKLALREVPMFRRYLLLADEFAWCCYEPARAAGAGPHNVPPEQVREPPLVFLSGLDTTPLALPRGASYEHEVAGSRLTVDEFRAVVQQLPVPVIGVPWFHLQHLPDVLVLAHEVGHHVEDDFRLTATLHRLLDEALQDAGVAVQRRPRWRGWLGEVFADVYGVLAGGPAFAQALMDFAATGVAPAGASAHYPPLDVRVRLALTALGHSGFPDQAEVLSAQWGALVPRLGTFDRELAAVAKALVDGPYPEFGAVRLTRVIDFSAHHEAAGTTASELLLALPLSASTIRSLVAGAAQAFADDPACYAEADGTRQVLDRLEDVLTAGPRGVVDVGDEQDAARRAYDRSHADDLLALITRTADRPSR